MDETAPNMEEMNKFIENKMIIGDKGEEIILKNESPARCLYGDRTHLYVWRWLDWVKNRHRYVRRFEGNGTPSRDNAVLRRIHRMTTLGPCIDDDDEGLGADDDLTLEKVANEGVRMDEANCRLLAEFIEFSALLSTARVLLVAVRETSDHGW